MSDTERCRYCMHPRGQHPVHDSEGEVACWGMEAWILDPEGYPNEDALSASEAGDWFREGASLIAQVPTVSDALEVSDE